MKADIVHQYYKDPETGVEMHFSKYPDWGWTVGFHNIDFEGGLSFQEAKEGVISIMRINLARTTTPMKSATTRLKLVLTNILCSVSMITGSFVDMYNREATTN